jgi:hypothetical protein
MQHTGMCVHKWIIMQTCTHHTSGRCAQWRLTFVDSVTHVPVFLGVPRSHPNNRAALHVAIMLYGHKLHDQAKTHLALFCGVFNDLDEEARNADPEVLEQSHVLGQLLGMY